MRSPLALAKPSQLSSPLINAFLICCGALPLWMVTVALVATSSPTGCKNHESTEDLYDIEARYNGRLSPDPHFS